MHGCQSSNRYATDGAPHQIPNSIPLSGFDDVYEGDPPASTLGMSPLRNHAAPAASRPGVPQFENPMEEFAGPNKKLPKAVTEEVASSLNQVLGRQVTRPHTMSVLHTPTLGSP